MYKGQPWTITDTHRFSRAITAEPPRKITSSGPHAVGRFLIGLVLLVRRRPVPCHLERGDDVADGAGIGAEGVVRRVCARPGSRRVAEHAGAWPRPASVRMKSMASIWTCSPSRPWRKVPAGLDLPEGGPRLRRYRGYAVMRWCRPPAAGCRRRPCSCRQARAASRTCSRRASRRSSVIRRMAPTLPPNRRNIHS